MTMPSSPLVELNEVSFRVGGRALVDGVSLDLHPGRLHVLVGPNGAGKTTLFRLATGELQPTSGTVAYEGRAMRDWPSWRLAAKRAVMTQSSSLAFSFTVADLVALGLDAVGRRRPAADRLALVADALAAADATHLAHRDHGTLSGGEQQRAQFARVMCQLGAGRESEERQVLFLDEPVASLDLKHQLALMQAAKAAARRGVAVLAIVHDLNLAATFADDLAVMSQGKLVARGRPDDILDDRLIAEVFGVKRVRVAGDARPAVALPQFYVA